MNESQIYDRLSAIFFDIFDDDGIVLRPETTARDVPGWDSFAHVNIIVATEQAFGIKFHAAEIGRLQNVSELVSLIARKTSTA